MATARPSPVWYTFRGADDVERFPTAFRSVELLVAERLGTDEREDRLDEARVDVLAGPAVRVAVVQRERDRHRGEHRCDPVCQPGRRQQRLLIGVAVEVREPRHRLGECAESGRSLYGPVCPNPLSRSITSPELRSER